MSQSLSVEQISALEIALNKLKYVDNIKSSGMVSQYWDLLCEGQKLQNLCGWKDPNVWLMNAVYNAIGPVNDIPHHATVLDVGAGSGLPGIVFACFRPDIKLISVEMRRKRAEFLQTVYQHLGINGEVICGDIKHVKTSVDIITARAVARPDELISMTKHLAHKKTRWILPQTPCDVAHKGAWHTTTYGTYVSHWWLSDG